MKYDYLDELNENEVLSLYESEIIESPYNLISFSCKVGDTCICGGTGSWENNTTTIAKCQSLLRNSNPTQAVSCYTANSDCARTAYCADVIGGECHF